MFLNFSGGMAPEGAFVLAGAMAFAWVRTPSSARAAVGIVAIIGGTWWIRSTPKDRAGVVSAIFGPAIAEQADAETT